MDGPPEIKGLAALPRQSYALFAAKIWFKAQKPLSEHERRRAIALVFGPKDGKEGPVQRPVGPGPAEPSIHPKAECCNSRPTWRRPAFVCGPQARRDRHCPD